jgi:hypothetical protein
VLRRSPLRAKPPAKPRGKEFKHFEPKPRAPAPSTGLFTGLLGGAADARREAAPRGRMPAWRSDAWLRAVAALPCVFCGAPSQAAHRNEGKGMGLKTDDCLTAALCPPHHAEIDQGGAMTREQRRARIDEAIVLTLRALVRGGRLVLVT